MKVSIILPVYNGEAYLDDCLASLLNQTLQEYEVICVDDGSIDRSGEILDRYQREYPDRIKVFHQKNEGVWKARAFAICQAQGEYVGFCDCDDCVEPDMYQVLYERVKRDSSEMAVCAYSRIDVETGKILCCEMQGFGDQIIEIQERLDVLTVINTSLWNKLILKDVALNHVNFEHVPRVAEDMMFLLSIYPLLHRISFCNRALYFYKIRSTSAISSVKPKELEILRQAMVKTKQFVLEQADGYGHVQEWEHVISTFAFIHFGIALISKIPDVRLKDWNFIQKDIERWLDSNFIDWRQNPYLKLRYVFCGHRYMLKPMVVLWMYRLGLFPLFLRSYKILVKKLKIDIKW